MNTRKIANEYRLQSWGAALSERAKDRESVKGFCERKGISKNTYYYWQRKLRKAAIEMMGELEASGSQAAIGAAKFTEVEIAKKPVKLIASGEEQVSRIIIEVGGVKITADISCPMEKLAALCRELTRT
jgi:putative transposase